MGNKKLNIRPFLLSSAIPLWGGTIKNYYHRKSGLSWDLKSNKKLIDFTTRYLRKCYFAKQQKQKLVWVNLPSVTEIFYALDVIPYMPESLGALMAALGFSNISLDNAYSLGFSRDTCTFCNHVMGINTFDQLPRPDMVIATVLTLCDAQGKAFEAVARDLQVPFHVIIPPSFNDTGHALDFFVDELWSLVRELEQLTGRTLTKESLKKSIDLSNASTDYFQKILELRKQSPPPIGGLDAFFSYYPLYNFCGDQQATLNFYKDLYEELKNKNSRQPTSDSASPHSIRLLNTGHYFPLYDGALINELETKHAVFVNEIFSQVLCNKVPPAEDDTLEGLLKALARKYLEMPTVGSFKSRVRLCDRMARDWQVDGAVHFIPWGCRVIGSRAYPLADYLSKTLNIPSLIIDADPLDRSIYARGAVQTRLHAFIEMLQEKKELSL